MPFQGARLRLATNVLDDSDFQRISPGETVEVKAKRVPFFRPGKELRARVNGGDDPEAR